MFLLLLLFSCMNYLLLCNKLSQNIIAKTINIQCHTVAVTQETGEPLSWVPLAQCLLWSCSPPVGQGCSYLKTGLGRRICFQDHSHGCHSFRSHGFWAAGHCSWSPCVDTSSRRLAVWQLASPRVSEPREGEGKNKQGRMLQEAATGFLLPNLRRVIPLLLSYPVHYMRVCKCSLSSRGGIAEGQGHGRWGSFGVI